MNNMYYEKDTIIMSRNPMKSDPFTRKLTGKMFMEPNNNSGGADCSEFVKEFYDDAVIFVTGGTGFLGKVLIEKLLRSCDSLRAIFVLLRPKRGLSSEQRFEEFVKNPVFDRIRSKTPEMLDRLEYISGDITQPQLGMSDQDHERLADEVTVVFHVAATVRFNESLRDAANLNTLGTQRVMELCVKMKHLKSVVHVSTAYSNPTRKNVGELVYPPLPPVDENAFMKAITSLPGDVLNMMTDKLQGSHPNTYTLTKSMAEQIVMDFGQSLPICIVRPSIVTAALEEPFPGWVDNVYGITGIMMEIGRGTISSIMCDEKCIMDLIPVDIVVNTMITAALFNAHYGPKTTRVYNCTSGQINPVKWNEFGAITKKYAIKNPTKYVLLYPGFKYRTNRTMHRIYELLFHFLPAYVFDIILRVQGFKPIMMKIAKRFQRAADTGEFFAMHEWIFENDNLRTLTANVKLMNDGNEFNCDMSHMDWDSYVESYMLGIRKYVLKDGMDSLPKARKKVKQLYCIKQVFQIFILFMALYFLHYFLDITTIYTKFTKMAGAL